MTQPRRTSGAGSFECRPTAYVRQGSSPSNPYVAVAFALGTANHSAPMYRPAAAAASVIVGGLRNSKCKYDKRKAFATVQAIGCAPSTPSCPLHASGNWNSSPRTNQAPQRPRNERKISKGRASSLHQCLMHYRRLSSF